MRCSKTWHTKKVCWQMINLTTNCSNSAPFTREYNPTIITTQTWMRFQRIHFHSFLLIAQIPTKKPSVLLPIFSLSPLLLATSIILLKILLSLKTEKVYRYSTMTSTKKNTKKSEKIMSFFLRKTLTHPTSFILCLVKRFISFLFHQTNLIFTNKKNF